MGTSPPRAIVESHPDKSTQLSPGVLFLYRNLMIYDKEYDNLKEDNIGRSSNGRTEAFEAFNLGSIPSLPAIL